MSFPSLPVVSGLMSRMPPKSDGHSGSRGMFLQMSDKDGGGIHQSPSFTFAAVDAPPARPVAEQNVGQSAAASNPYQWSDEPTAAVSAEYPDSVPTPTDGRSFSMMRMVADKQVLIRPTPLCRCHHTPPLILANNLSPTLTLL
jgi:hypothetical protein